LQQGPSRGGEEKPPVIAVIDVGKTNAKVVLIDGLSGAELASRTARTEIRQDGPYPHLDAARIWGFLCEALAELNRAHRVSAISIAAHGAAGAFISAEAGEDGLALPILDYEFTGPDEFADEYDAARPGFDESLSPRLPAGLNLGAQIFWQHKRFPEAFGRAAYVNYPQYWAWRLTGGSGHRDVLDGRAYRPVEPARAWLVEPGRAHGLGQGLRAAASRL
jgi:sugar (pentulose or hexulose) kinase